MDRIEWEGHKLTIKVGLRPSDIIIRGDVNEMRDMAMAIMDGVEEIEDVLAHDATRDSCCKDNEISLVTLVNAPSIKAVPAKEEFPEGS